MVVIDCKIIAEERMKPEYITLGICQADARSKCLKQSEASFDQLQDAFSRVFRVFNDAMQRIWNNYGLMVQKTECGSHRIIAGSGGEGVGDREIFESILSVFALSILPIRQLIFEGSYVSACTLLRSNIETMVQLRKVLKGEYKRGKTPKISGEDERIKRIYSEITGLAHLSDDLFLSDITKGHSAVESFDVVTPMFRVLAPQFNHGFGKCLFALHIICFMEIMALINEYLEKNIPGRSIPENDFQSLSGINEFLWSTFS